MPWGEWAEKMLHVFAVKGQVEETSQLAKLRKAFPQFSQSRDFIVLFASTTTIISQVLEILKNNGLDKTTYKQCVELSKKLPRNSKVKKCLQTWLKKHFIIQKKLTSLPLLVSSDIIESLFGNFKHIIERSPQADINVWEKKHISYTVRKKRHAFFNDSGSQNTGNYKTA